MSTDGRPAARIRVPCSTSNLGAGFDCVGIALDRWLEAEVHVTEEPSPRFERGGTLAGTAHADADDLTWHGFRLACEAAGVAPPPGVRFATTSEIPVARGLGSSAAALVAGALLADALLGLALAAEEVVRVCAAVEGHPDNVAPIALGGAVLAVPAGDGYVLRPLAVDRAVGFAICVPDFETSTRVARSLLPQTVPHRTAVVAAAKSAALVAGLARGDGELLSAALDDVLHVPFRRAMIHQYDAVAGAAVAAGAWGATLSGSGSTLIALAPAAEAARVAAAMERCWQAHGIAAAGSVVQVAHGPERVPPGVSRSA